MEINENDRDGEEIQGSGQWCKKHLEWHISNTFPNDQSSSVPYKIAIFHLEKDGYIVGVFIIQNLLICLQMGRFSLTKRCQRKIWSYFSGIWRDVTLKIKTYSLPSHRITIFLKLQEGRFQLNIRKSSLMRKAFASGANYWRRRWTFSACWNRDRTAFHLSWSTDSCTEQEILLMTMEQRPILSLSNAKANTVKMVTSGKPGFVVS